MSNATSRPIVLFDSDDFYGLTLDLILFNFQLDSAKKIRSRKELEEFEKQLEQGKFQKAVYIFDEYFGEGKIDVSKLIEQIKSKDSAAVTLCYTVSEPEEIELKNKYDHIVKKTNRTSEGSMIDVLSKVMGLNFVANNNDPELDFSGK